MAPLPGGVSRHEPESVCPVRAVEAAADRGWFVGTGGYTFTYREWREGMMGVKYGRRDSNHNEIRDAARRMGATVIDTPN